MPTKICDFFSSSSILLFRLIILSFHPYVFQNFTIPVPCELRKSKTVRKKEMDILWTLVIIREVKCTNVKICNKKRINVCSKKWCLLQQTIPIRLRSKEILHSSQGRREEVRAGGGYFRKMGERSKKISPLTAAKIYRC
jgi:hypothetical protein